MHLQNQQHSSQNRVMISNNALISGTGPSGGSAYRAKENYKPGQYFYSWLIADGRSQPLTSIHAISDRENVSRASNENVVKNPDPYLARRSMAGEV